jgi:hypothetical protein
VAVGTFGGTVVSVDVIDNGKGKFRCQIRPDKPEEWPNERYLRQGVRANGWVLLEQVPLWFEFWRQLNGFPPSLDAPSAATALGGGKSDMAPITQGTPAKARVQNPRSSNAPLHARRNCARSHKDSRPCQLLRTSCCFFEERHRLCSRIACAQLKFRTPSLSLRSEIDLFAHSARLVFEI